MIVAITGILSSVRAFPPQSSHNVQFSDPGRSVSGMTMPGGGHPVTWTFGILCVRAHGFAVTTRTVRGLVGGYIPACR